MRPISPSLLAFAITVAFSADSLAAVIGVPERLRPMVTTSRVKQTISSAVSAERNAAAAKLSNRGLMKLKAGRRIEAQIDFEAAIRKDPGYAPAWMHRGVIEATMENYSSAIRYYTRALKIDPRYTAAYHSRGLAHQKIKSSDQALEDFSAAIAIDAEFAPAYVKRGAIYGRSGKLTQSIADNTRAIALQPDDPVAYNNRAAALSKLGRTAEAQLDLAKSQQLSRKAAKKE